MSRRFLGVGRLTRVVIWGLLAAAALPVLAGASTLQLDAPLPPALANPCNFETVINLQGTVHIVTETQGDGTLKVMTNVEGATGVGSLSGLTYTVSEETHTFTLLPNEDLYDYRKLIRRGENGDVLPDDAYLRIHASYTGSVPSPPDFSVECR